MTAISIPPPTQPISDDELITEPWYRVMLEIQRLRQDFDASARFTRGLGVMDSKGSVTAAFVGST